MKNMRVIKRINSEFAIKGTIVSSRLKRNACANVDITCTNADITCFNADIKYDSGTCTTEGSTSACHDDFSGDGQKSCYVDDCADCTNICPENCENNFILSTYHLFRIFYFLFGYRRNR